MNISPIQRQSLIAFSTTVITTLAGFFATIYFAHTLGPAPLGLYSLFLAYFGIFNLVGDGGFGGAAVKRISEGKDQDEYFSAFVVIRLAFLALSISVLLCVEPYVRDITSSGIFFWLILALVIAVFQNSTGSGVYGSGKVGIYQISLIVEWLFRILFQVIAVYLGYSAAGLAGGFVGGLVAGGIVQLRYLERRLVRFRFFHVKNLSTFSFWIFLTSSGLLIFSYTDTILIGIFLNTTEIGVYRTAFQLASVGSFITLAFQTVLYPKISSLAAQGRFSEIENSLARACTYSLFLAIPTCVGGWILGERLLYFLYGSSFTEGTVPLFIILAVQIINIYMYLGTTGLNALDHPKEAFTVTFVASVANILLNIELIPILGITGAALSTLVAVVLNAGGAFILLSRRVRVKIEYSPVKKIVCSSGIMAVFLLLVRFLIPLSNFVWVLAAVSAGALLYFMIILRWDREIRDDLKAISTHLGLPWPKWL